MEGNLICGRLSMWLGWLFLFWQGTYATNFKLYWKEQLVHLGTRSFIWYCFWGRSRSFSLLQSYKMFSKSLMPCPFTGHKMFCAGLNFLSQPKNLTAFSASSKTFVLAQKPILLNANHLFVWHKMFVTATICK